MQREKVQDSHFSLDRSLNKDLYCIRHTKLGKSETSGIAALGGDCGFGFGKKMMSFSLAFASRRSRDILVGILCAGLSAALLAIAHTFQAYWLISLIALIPFLWWTSRNGSYTGAAGIGMVLGLFFGLAVFGGQFLMAPGAVLLRIVILSAVFAAFGFLVCWSKRKIGLNPILVAAFWVPLEYIFVRSAGSGSVMALPPVETLLSLDLNTMLGLLLGSFVMVLANGLILALLRYIHKRLRATNSPVPANRRPVYRRLSLLMHSRDWFLFPDNLSPPALY